MNQNHLHKQNLWPTTLQEMEVGKWLGQSIRKVGKYKGKMEYVRKRTMEEINICAFYFMCGQVHIYKNHEII